MRINKLKKMGRESRVQQWSDLGLVEWMRSVNKTTIHFTSHTNLQSILKDGIISPFRKDTGLHGDRSWDGKGLGACQRMIEPGLSAVYFDLGAAPGSFHDPFYTSDWYGITIGAASEVVGLQLDVSGLKVFDYDPFDAFDPTSEARSRTLLPPGDDGGRWTNCEHCVIGEIPVSRVERVHLFVDQRFITSLSLGQYRERI